MRLIRGGEKGGMGYGGVCVVAGGGGGELYIFATLVA